MSYILMWLEAPLQSWGVNSKYQRRDTLNFPSKSGIMGIILSALGKTGEQKEWEKFQNCDKRMIVCALLTLRTLFFLLHISLRCLSICVLLSHQS